jgi:hypothetical protein
MRIMWISLVCLAIGCNQKSKEETTSAIQPANPASAPTTNGGEEGIPLGAIKEEFADIQGLVRVTLTDQGGLKSADG